MKTNLRNLKTVAFSGLLASMTLTSNLQAMDPAEGAAGQDNSASLRAASARTAPSSSLEVDLSTLPQILSAKSPVTKLIIGGESAGITPVDIFPRLFVGRTPTKLIIRANTDMDIGPFVDSMEGHPSPKQAFATLVDLEELEIASVISSPARGTARFMGVVLPQLTKLERLSLGLYSQDFNRQSIAALTGISALKELTLYRIL